MQGSIYVSMKSQLPTPTSHRRLQTLYQNDETHANVAIGKLTDGDLQALSPLVGIFKTHGPEGREIAVVWSAHTPS